MIFIPPKLASFALAQAGSIDWSALLSSPVFIAIVTTLGVKLFDIIRDRWKIDSEDRRDIRKELWTRLDVLEEDTKQINKKNDELVAENARLVAQNTIQIAELAKIQTDRTFCKDIADTNKQLAEDRLRELRAAIAHIRILEQYVISLGGSVSQFPRDDHEHSA